MVCSFQNCDIIFSLVTLEIFKIGSVFPATKQVHFAFQIILLKTWKCLSDLKVILQHFNSPASHELLSEFYFHTHWLQYFAWKRGTFSTRKGSILLAYFDHQTAPKIDIQGNKAILVKLFQIHHRSCHYQWLWEFDSVKKVIVGSDNIFSMQRPLLQCQITSFYAIFFWKDSKEFHCPDPFSLTSSSRNRFFGVCFFIKIPPPSYNFTSSD